MKVGEPSSWWCHAVWTWGSGETTQRLPDGLQAAGKAARWDSASPEAWYHWGHGVTSLRKGHKLKHVRVFVQCLLNLKIHLLHLERQINSRVGLYEDR